MANKLFLLLVASSLASALLGHPGESGVPISADRIRADVAYLASDRLEGRAPGTRGETLTTEYLAAEFKKAGLKPLGKNGTYLQPVPLVRVVTSPASTLQAVKGEPPSTSPAGTASPARARRRGDWKNLTPRRSSSATALPRPSSTGTTTRAST